MSILQVTFLESQHVTIDVTCVERQLLYILDNTCVKPAREYPLDNLCDDNHNE